MNPSREVRKELLERRAYHWPSKHHTHWSRNSSCNAVIQWDTFKLAIKKLTFCEGHSTWMKFILICWGKRSSVLLFQISVHFCLFFLFYVQTPWNFCSYVFILYLKLIIVIMVIMIAIIVVVCVNDSDVGFMSVINGVVYLKVWQLNAVIFMLNTSSMAYGLHNWFPKFFKLRPRASQITSLLS